MHLSNTCCTEPCGWRGTKCSGIEPVVRRRITDINRPTEIVSAHSAQRIWSPYSEWLAGLRTCNAADFPSPCQMSREAMLFTEEWQRVRVAAREHLISGERRWTIAVVAIY